MMAQPVKAANASTLTVAVGSTNPVKVRAVKAAVQWVLQQRGEEREVEVRGHAAASGVAAQPFSDAETKQGATNRAQAVLAMDPSAELAFGLEGGVMKADDTLYSVVWVTLTDRQGTSLSLAGNRFPLPEVIVRGLRTGKELGDVMDELEDRENIRQEEGMFGVLTDGVIPRQEAYEYLVKFVYALYCGEWMKK